ncbi:MAG: sulfite exporter TauE/SafE family protein [Thermodesulfovibrionales bacterium]
MPPPFIFFLIGTGASVGLLSGLLGLGGGIIMFPLLLYVPPLLGFEPVPVKDITGLTMAQGFFASLSAMFFYNRERLVNRHLVLTLGLSLFLSSLAGSLLSKWIADTVLLLVFGLLACTASGMMFIPRTHMHDELKEESVVFHRPTAIAAGIIIGFLVGLVGQGGAFITIPVMLYILKIPLRVTLGSTLAIGLFSASAGMIGKTLTGQVPYSMALIMVASAMPAAQFGSMISKKTSTRVLRWLLAAIISATALKVLADILLRQAS